MAQKKTIPPQQDIRQWQKKYLPLLCPTKTVFIVLSLSVPGIIGCQTQLSNQVEAQPSQEREAQTPSVEVQVARSQSLGESSIYTGNTQPIQEVSLRSRIEGRILDLNVDVGDTVQNGQLLARLDDTLLKTTLTEQESELRVRQAEVTRARNEVRNAEVKAQQARVELRQAQADAKRFSSLADSGAVSRQQAELAQTQAEVAAQVLNSAQEQIRIEKDAVATIEERVKVQRAVLAQQRERNSYALLSSPITGVVLERLNETGNVIQPGEEVLKLGDFREVKVVIPISELALSGISVGQSVTVRLDALANESISGVVSRISPAGNVTTRQVPVEVTIPNPERRIGSGLLARVEFNNLNSERVVIPESALQGEDENTVFVLNENEETVTAKTVEIGERKNDRVEIISGLNPGERFVRRSSRPLKTGEAVLLSVLSES